MNTELHEQVEIGFEKDERIDPVTGQREKVGGVYTTTGAGVGIGSKGGPPTERDLEAMERELSDKGLPEGNAKRPVAGYLYFPLSEKKKGDTYELECTLGGAKMVVPLRASR